MLFFRKEKFALSQSVIVAIQLTQAMAEALANSQLTLFQASIIAEKINESDDKDYADRRVKTDCVFIDNHGNKRAAVAWVVIRRWSNGEWCADQEENLIKLDDDIPRRMKFELPSAEEYIIAQPFTRPSVLTNVKGYLASPDLMDYSRIH